MQALGYRQGLIIDRQAVGVFARYPIHKTTLRISVPVCSWHVESNRRVGIEWEHSRPHSAAGEASESYQVQVDAADNDKEEQNMTCCSRG
jgi:hypothetical protein